MYGVGLDTALAGLLDQRKRTIEPRPTNGDARSTNETLTRAGGAGSVLGWC
jgi:hypothetical protein